MSYLMRRQVFAVCVAAGLGVSACGADSDVPAAAEPVVQVLSPGDAAGGPVGGPADVPVGGPVGGPADGPADVPVASVGRWCDALKNPPSSWLPEYDEERQMAWAADGVQVLADFAADEIAADFDLMVEWIEGLERLEDATIDTLGFSTVADPAFDALFAPDVLAPVVAAQDRVSAFSERECLRDLTAENLDAIDNLIEVRNELQKRMLDLVVLSETVIRPLHDISDPAPERSIYDWLVDVWGDEAVADCVATDGDLQARQFFADQQDLDVFWAALKRCAAQT